MCTAAVTVCSCASSVTEADSLFRRRGETHCIRQCTAPLSGPAYYISNSMQRVVAARRRTASRSDTPSASPSLLVSVSVSAAVVVCLASCAVLLLIAAMTETAGTSEEPVERKEALQTMTLETMTALAVCSTAHSLQPAVSPSLLLRLSHAPLCCADSRLLPLQ